MQTLCLGLYVQNNSDLVPLFNVLAEKIESIVLEDQYVDIASHLINILCLSMVDNGDFVTLDFMKRFVRPMCDYGGLVYMLFQFVAQYLYISYSTNSVFDT